MKIFNAESCSIHGCVFCREPLYQTLPRRHGHTKGNDAQCRNIPGGGDDCLWRGVHRGLACLICDVGKQADCPLTNRFKGLRSAGLYRRPQRRPAGLLINVKRPRALWSDPELALPRLGVSFAGKPLNPTGQSPNPRSDGVLGGAARNVDRLIIPAQSSTAAINRTPLASAAVTLASSYAENPRWLQANMPLRNSETLTSVGHPVVDLPVASACTFAPSAAKPGYPI